MLKTKNQSQPNDFSFGLNFFFIWRKEIHDSVQNIKPLNDNLIQNRIQGFRFSSGNLTRKVPENIPYATFSSFFMMEKMNRAESRQSTMSTLHTIHNSMPPHR